MTAGEMVNLQRDFFHTGQTREIEYRKKALKQLLTNIKRMEAEILTALQEDLNKSEFEGYMTELGMVYEEIRFALKHVKRWGKREKVKSPMSQFPSRSYIYSEPYGVVLIISPWNYPFQLSVAPLIGAIAAGNCAIIKPSEYAPATEKILSKLIGETFPKEYITVMEGGVEVSSALLKEPFDFIFYTGGETVGKIVMESAAKHLTPVALELGGKSPTIVEESANIQLAAKRIAFGKFLNAGQTCVAPDYVLVHSSKKEDFLHALVHWIEIFYTKKPLENESYPKVITKRHFDRLLSYLDDGTVYYGGEWKEETTSIAPTILTHVKKDSAIMKEEIFGPILPVLTFETIPEVVDYIVKRPKPLACYLFTTNKEVEEQIMNQVSFGGGCVNDTVIHLATPYMGFGGVGSSGMGSYHGKQSFDTFSHKKSILKKSNLFDLPLRYQPYTKVKLKWLRRFM